MTEISSENHELIEIFKLQGACSSAKFFLDGNQFDLDLRILMTNLHTYFHLKMSIHDRDNEWKPLIKRKSKGHNSDWN